MCGLTHICKCVLCPKTPPTQPMDDSPLFGGTGGPVGRDQAFFSEISEHDIEVLRQREEALVQIEVSTSMLPFHQIRAQKTNACLSVCLSVSLKSFI